MKPISGLVLCAALLLPGGAFAAGWGAIAYNPATGASTEAHGQAHLSTALNAALNACGSGCLVVTWEHNTCIAFATNGRGSWGDAFNYPNHQAGDRRRRQQLRRRLRMAGLGLQLRAGVLRRAAGCDRRSHNIAGRRSAAAKAN